MLHCFPFRVILSEKYTTKFQPELATLNQMDEFYTPWMHKLNKLLDKTWFSFWSGNCNALSCLHICDHHFFVCGLWCQKPHETKCNKHLIEASLLNPDNLVFTNFPGFLNQFQKLCLSKYSNQDVLQCSVWKGGLDGQLRLNFFPSKI